MEDKEIIKGLLEQGYHVEVVDPEGSTFNGRYRVWQNVGWDLLRTVVVQDDGQIYALEG
jgi:hypothetical protein